MMPCDIDTIVETGLYGPRVESGPDLGDFHIEKENRMDRTAVLGQLLRDIGSMIDQLPSGDATRGKLVTALQNAAALTAPSPGVCDCLLPSGVHMQLTPAECKAGGGRCQN
jgi:hypothetical protein